MTPLPPPLGKGELVFWRLDEVAYASTWNRGEGSYRAGGRWSPLGMRVIYAALDPATAILEVAVHKGFHALDTERHVLTQARIVDLRQVYIVESADIPNPNWLKPGRPSAGQQEYGAALMNAHAFVLIPSVVSNHSWNVIFESEKAAPLYDCVGQEPFALDTRLHPAPRSGD